jgi:hypothetical protein
MIAVGVDTHKERHCAAALDELCQVLGESTFMATAAGYADLQRWAEAWRDFMVSDYSDAGQERWLASAGIDLLRGSGRSPGLASWRSTACAIPPGTS